MLRLTFPYRRPEPSYLELFRAIRSYDFETAKIRFNHRN